MGDCGFLGLKGIGVGGGDLRKALVRRFLHPHIIDCLLGHRDDKASGR